MQSPSSGYESSPAGGRTTGFLEESPGNRSSMRLMCMMALITSIILSGLVVGQALQQSGRPVPPGGVYQPRDPDVLYIIFGFLIAAFAPKAVQKFAEQKLPAYDPTLATRQATTMYAGYLPPAPAVTPPAPVARAPVEAPAPAAVMPVSPTPAAPVSPSPAAPAVPTPLQNVLQRGAL